MNDNQVDLKTALQHPIWQNHKIDNTYKMDGKGEWKIAYYPIFGCGKTGKVYNEPRALVESKSNFNGVSGTDFREVPLHYLEVNLIDRRPCVGFVRERDSR